MKRIWKCIIFVLFIAILYSSTVKAVTDGRIEATIDVIETYGNTLHVRGWAFDKYNPGASVTIDVDFKRAYSANQQRDDVNNAYGISGQHGFDFEYPWTSSGERLMMTVCYSDGTGGCALFDNISVFPNVFTVAYNANGGSNAPATDYKHQSISLRLSNQTPTRTGYTFKGWSTSSNGTASYQPGSSYNAEASTTLYAVWQKNTYTISYDANGGSGAPGNQTGQYQSSITLSNTIPVREGYDFKGWATSSNGNAAYQPGGKLTVNGNVKLYAVWSLKTYAVTYDANGGSGAPTAQTKTYGQTLLLSETEPTLTDYVFTGWARNQEATDPEFLPGDPYDDNAALNLFAVWIEARRPGDVNGDWTINSEDAELLLEYLAEKDVNIVEQNSDVNGDDIINGKDALRLMKYLGGQNVDLQ